MPANRRNAAACDRRLRTCIAGQSNVAARQQRMCPHLCKAVKTRQHHQHPKVNRPTIQAPGAQFAQACAGDVVLFNSIPFLFAFLPVTLAGYLILVRRSDLASLAWLVACSLVFYAYGDIAFAPIMMTSVILNYLAGIALASTEGRTKTLLLTLAIAANLSALGYFKYTNFFLQNLNDAVGAGLVWEKVILPIGISFFTFQQIAYLVDAYRGQIIERNPLRYAALICFFPHLIAGPIVHPKEVLPQLRQRRVPTSADISAGLSLLIIGLVKKIVIADTMAIQSSTMFSATAAGATPSMLEAWLGALCYTLQIYFDFSAYSDMAVGLARMFAIDFPINFASPYKARSIAEFWRRWHISLSRFLRDYLYIPLGGKRVGITRQQANLLIVMVIGGFWHGAAWTFIAWGALHGLYLLVHRWWQSRSLAGWLGRTAWWRYPACALTFLAVLVAWVPFRADDMTVATKIWASLFGLNGLALDAGRVQWDIATAALALLPLIFLAPSSYEIMAGARLGLPTHGYPATYISRAPVHWRPSPRWAAALACGSLLILLKINDVSEFIYFQF